MVDALSGFQPDRLTGMLWTVLGGWLIWPLLCGVLGRSKGMTLKGITHGLFWGPIGIGLIMFAKRKHACPTCGCKTLDRAFQPRMPDPSEMAAEPGRHLQSERFIPTARPSGAAPAEMVPDLVKQPQESSSRHTDIREPARDLRALVDQASAGYSEAEAARLLAWVNDQAAALADEVRRPRATTAPKPTGGIPDPIPKVVAN